jgi:Protein of unknown function (DUF2817)
MMSPAQAFADSYARARVLFLEGAAVAGMAIRSFDHPLPGRDGETLAVDTALDGPADSPRWLVVSSGTQGIGGFCGSGVQVFATHDAAWRAHARQAGVSVLYIHALDPHGFSHRIRVTHDTTDSGRKAIAAPLEAEEVQRLQPDGLFQTGTLPDWSHRTLLQGVAPLLRHARDIAWIDLVVGPGLQGLGERLFSRADGAQALARARAWWGVPAADVPQGTGDLRDDGVWNALRPSLEGTAVTGLMLGFATAPDHQVLHAMRTDRWLHGHPETPAPMAQSIRDGMSDAFVPSDDAWRAQVVVHSRQAMFQAVAGLTDERPGA